MHPALSTTKKYNHAEAFCHMTYSSYSDYKNLRNMERDRKNGPPRLKIEVRIWNSRDGITPMFCNFPGTDHSLMHSIISRDDECDPYYKPKKGDYIWRDWKRDEAEAFYRDFYPKLLETRSKQPAMNSVYERLLETGVDGYMAIMMKQFHDGDPHLELVKEDWK